MVQARVVARRKKAAAGLLLSAVLLGGLGQRSSGAEVTTVTGSAFGCFASVALFGGPPNVVGPMPTVNLPPGGSAVPLTATLPTCNAQFGPATIFSAGPTTVSTQGTTGPTGSVTSTATLAPINTSQSEIFTAASLSSTCTADESDATGSTTITAGNIILQDPNPDVSGEEGEEVEILPVNPSPNTEFLGTVANVNDNFRAVFNEQIVDPVDGSLTVNAFHLYLLGPTAIGELIVGQVVCGASTTSAPGGGGNATTTTQPGGATSTTQGGNTTTTTTRSGGSGGTSADPAVPTDGEPRFTG